MAKNLANCKPTEFLKQTNAIRKYVEHWFKVTDIMEIRKKMPAIPDGATEDEKKKLLEEQMRKNFSEMLDAALEEHPEETVGVMALACFVPLEEAEDHTMDYYLGSVAEIMESKNCMRFFTSLARLGLNLGQ